MPENIFTGKNLWGDNNSLVIYVLLINSYLGEKSWFHAFPSLNISLMPLKFDTNYFLFSIYLGLKNHLKSVDSSKLIS